MKFIMLINVKTPNVKMPTVGILAFISMIYTMHNKFSNFLRLASFLCSSLRSAEQFQLQWRKQDLRQMKPLNFRRHPLNRHLGRARMAEGVSKQKSHPLKVMLK